MEVLTTGGVGASLRIEQRWIVTGEECRSLFHVESPVPLAGTTVLLVEQAGASDIEVWLRLKTARAPVSVPSERTREHFLGTDFTYEDLRFWLPVSAFDDAVVIPDGEARDVVRATRRETGEAVEVELDRSTGCVLALRHGNEGRGHRRELLASGYHARAGVWTPTRLVAARLDEGYRSVMDLLDVAYGVSLDRSQFEPAALRAPIPPSAREAGRG